MPAQKKGRSSKTNHVLSLLSGAGVPTEPQTEEKEPGEKQAAQQPQEQQSEKKETAPQKRKRTPSKLKEQLPQAEEKEKEQEEPIEESVQKAAPSEMAEPAPRRTLTPPIVEVARANNEMLAETIKNALNEALEEEIAQQEQEKEQLAMMQKQKAEPEQKPELMPVQEEPQLAVSQQEAPQEELQETETILPPEAEILPPDWEPSPVMEQKPLPEQEEPQEEQKLEPQSKPELAPVQAMQQPFMPPMPQMPQDLHEQGRLPDGSVFINVMELLVDEKLERYVKMFGLCDCLRCLADAKALALSRLQAKYVVLEENTRIPMLSFYEAKYEELVIPEVIHACKTVMEHPRHKI